MKYLRIKEVTKKLHISRATLYRRIDDKTLPDPFYFGKTPMWTEEQIDHAMTVLMNPESQPTTASA